MNNYILIVYMLTGFFILGRGETGSEEFRNIKTDTINKTIIMMDTLPEVQVIEVKQPIIAICKEFKGPYNKSTQYIAEVQKMLDKKGIDYKPNRVLGIYFDNPQEKAPEELRSYQGVPVENATEYDLSNSYFTYSLKGKYLYTKVTGNPSESIQQGYQALFSYIEQNDISLSSPAGIQISTFEEGAIVTEIYMALE